MRIEAASLAGEQVVIAALELLTSPRSSPRLLIDNAEDHEFSGPDRGYSNEADDPAVIDIVLSHGIAAAFHEESFVPFRAH